jgi:hypothetical protein
MAMTSSKLMLTARFGGRSRNRAYMKRVEQQRRDLTASHHDKIEAKSGVTAIVITPHARAGMATVTVGAMTVDHVRIAPIAMIGQIGHNKTGPSKSDHNGTLTTDHSGARLSRVNKGGSQTVPVVIGSVASRTGAIIRTGHQIVAARIVPRNEIAAAWNAAMRIVVIGRSGLTGKIGLTAASVRTDRSGLTAVTGSNVQSVRSGLTDMTGMPMARPVPLKQRRRT